MSGAEKVPPWLPDLVAGAFSVGLLAVNFVTDVDQPVWLTIVALICFGIAIPFVALPFLHLSRYGKPKSGDAFFKTTRIVERGIYSLVRHPQYLGYSFLVLGFFCLNPNALSICLAAGAIAFFYLQSIVEERFCAEQLGSEYDAYSMRVPRMNFVLGMYRAVRRRLSKN